MNVKATNFSGTLPLGSTSDTDPAPASLLGQVVTDYQLLEKIGSGGFGEVWKGIGPGGLLKAVKILHGRSSGVQAESELKAMRRIRDVRHPFLLSVERIEEWEDRLVIVTELAEYNLEDLAEKYRRQGLNGIPREELLNYLNDAADALDYITREHRLQHLDIKPDNLMIQGGHCKVGDFGLAKHITDTANQSMINGFTPLYAPPEIFEGRPGEFSDQYSLAIVYQMMLTGRTPYNGRTLAQLMTQHLTGDPDLSLLPPTDRPIIAKALSRRPTDRYDDCRSLVRALMMPADQVTKPDASAAATAMARAPKRETTLRAPTPMEPVIASPQAPRPVCFIGVGGLGGRVVSKLQEAMGDANSLPSPLTSFLYLDTEQRDHSGGNSSDSAARVRSVAFPLQSAAHYRSRGEELLPWLRRRWLFNIPRSGEIEGMRPLGRLALLGHEAEVRKAIRDELQGLKNSPGEASDVEIVVVSSVNGGTGSGCLADLICWITQECGASDTAGDHALNLFLLQGLHTESDLADVRRAGTLATFRELATVPELVDDQATLRRTLRNIWLTSCRRGSDEDSDWTDRCARFLRERSVGSGRNLITTWEAADEQEQSDQLPGVQLLGLASLDHSQLSSAQQSAGRLARGVIRVWTDRPDRTSAIPEWPATFLKNHGLSAESMQHKVMKCLRGGLGRQVESMSAECMSACSDTGTETDPQKRLQRFEELLVGSQENAGTGQLTAGILEPLNQLKAEARATGQTLQTAIRQDLDRGIHPTIVQQILHVVLVSIADAEKQCRALDEDIHASLNDLRPEFRHTDVPEDTLRRFVVMTAYRLIYATLLEGLTNTAALAEQVAVQLTSLRKKMSQALAENSEVDSQSEHVQAFLQAMTARSDWHLSDYLDGDKQPATAHSLLEDLTRLAVRHQPATKTSADDVSSRIGEENGEAARSFPGNAVPLITNLGGGRRVAVLCQEPSDATAWMGAMESFIGQEPQVIASGNDELFVVCRDAYIPLSSVAEAAIGQATHLKEVANRLLTRRDVDWHPLVD